MARCAVTLQVDEELLAAAEAEAGRTGATGSDVVEQALRHHFAETNGTILDQVWARNAASELSEEEVLELAYSELKAMPRAARGPDKAASVSWRGSSSTPECWSGRRSVGAARRVVTSPAGLRRSRMGGLW